MKNSRTIAASAIALAFTASAHALAVSEIRVRNGAIQCHTHNTITLVLDGPAPSGTVAIVADDSPIISFPRYVPFAPGATEVSFSVYAGADLLGGITEYPVHITASVGNTTPATGSFLIFPTTAWYFGTDRNAYGGDAFAGAVQVAYPGFGAAPLDINFSDNSPFVGSPASVRLTYNYDDTRTLKYHSFPVSAATDVTLRSSCLGFNLDTTVTLHPRPTLIGFSLSPRIVVGGNPVTGTLQFDIPGAVGPLKVTFAADQSRVVLPKPYLSVPPGTATMVFDMDTIPVTYGREIFIQARCREVTRTASFYIARP